MPSSCTGNNTRPSGSSAFATTKIWRPVRIGGWTSVEKRMLDQQEATVGRQNRLCRHPIGLCRSVYRMAFRAKLQLAVRSDRCRSGGGWGRRRGARIVFDFGADMRATSQFHYAPSRARRSAADRSQSGCRLEPLGSSSRCCRRRSSEQQGVDSARITLPAPSIMLGRSPDR